MKKIFDDIPDDYNMQEFKGKISVYYGCELPNKMGFYHQLYNQNLISKDMMQSEMLSDSAVHYVYSAIKVFEAHCTAIKYSEEGVLSVSFCYMTPCAFLCRHAVELKLKSLLFDMTHNLTLIRNKHSVGKLFDLLSNYNFKKYLSQTDYDEVKCFITMLDDFDPDGSQLRYAFNNDGEPYDMKNQLFSIHTLIKNTKHFFNILNQLSIKCI